MAPKDPEKRPAADASSYHGSHVPPARQPAPMDEPAVIIERPKQPPTLRIDRSKLPTPPSFVEAAPARPAERTFVTAPRQGRRVVVALFAAVLVVFAIFVAMKMWVTAEKKKATAADPSASAFIDGHAPPPKSWTPKSN